MCYITGVVFDNFLLVSDPFRQSLHQVNLADESVWRFPLTNKQLIYVVYDGVEMKMYLNEQTVVKRTMLNETASENITPRYASEGNSYLCLFILKHIYLLYGRLGRIKVLRKYCLAIVVTSSQPF